MGLGALGRVDEGRNNRTASESTDQSRVMFRKESKMKAAWYKTKSVFLRIMVNCTLTYLVCSRVGGSCFLFLGIAACFHTKGHVHV
jgi:hypothetical protein